MYKYLLDRNITFTNKFTYPAIDKFGRITGGGIGYHTATTPNGISLNGGAQNCHSQDCRFWTTNCSGLWWSCNYLDYINKSGENIWPWIGNGFSYWSGICGLYSTEEGSSISFYEPYPDLNNWGISGTAPWLYADIYFNSNNGTTDGYTTAILGIGTTNLYQTAVGVWYNQYNEPGNDYDVYELDDVHFVSKSTPFHLSSLYDYNTNIAYNEEYKLRLGYRRFSEIDIGNSNISITAGHIGESGHIGVSSLTYYKPKIIYQATPPASGELVNDYCVTTTTGIWPGWNIKSDGSMVSYLTIDISAGYPDYITHPLFLATRDLDEPLEGYFLSHCIPKLNNDYQTTWTKHFPDSSIGSYNYYIWVSGNLTEGGHGTWDYNLATDNVTIDLYCPESWYKGTVYPAINESHTYTMSEVVGSGTPAYNVDGVYGLKVFYYNFGEIEIYDNYIYGYGTAGGMGGMTWYTAAQSGRYFLGSLEVTKRFGPRLLTGNQYSVTPTGDTYYITGQNYYAVKDSGTIAYPHITELVTTGNVYFCDNKVRDINIGDFNKTFVATHTSAKDGEFLHCNTRVIKSMSMYGYKYIDRHLHSVTDLSYVAPVDITCSPFDIEYIFVNGPPDGWPQEGGMFSILTCPCNTHTGVNGSIYTGDLPSKGAWINMTTLGNPIDNKFTIEDGNLYAAEVPWLPGFSNAYDAPLISITGVIITLGD